MQWTYRGEPVTDDVIGDNIGFVYVITCLATGRKYIGKKLFKSRRTRKPLKGHKRKRRDLVASDWETYWGSSLELQRDVEELGMSAFSREVLYLCKTRGVLNYAELREQVTRDVLLKPDEYYNSFVGGKFHRKHVLSSS